MVDDEATLSMVEDLYLSGSEEAVPAERNTPGNAPQHLATLSLGDNVEQPFDHLPVSPTPLPQPPEQITEQSFNHIPGPAAPQALLSEQSTSEQPSAICHMYFLHHFEYHKHISIDGIVKVMIHLCIN